MAELKIGQMVLGSVQTNCYFLYEEGKTDVILFDPADKGDYIYEKLREKGFSIAAIFLTHAHFDHIWGCNKVKELCGGKVYANEEERDLCESSDLNVSAQVGRPYTIKPDIYLKDGETVTINGIQCKMIATPGHTKGSCCYYFEEDAILVSGDTLFLESVGRTDLATGSMSELTRSLKQKILTLPEAVTVYPGHGDSTSIGHEKKYNPFC